MEFLTYFFGIFIIFPHSGSQLPRHSRLQDLRGEEEEEEANCAVSNWGRWSDCSMKCQEGTQ